MFTELIFIFKANDISCKQQEKYVFNRGLMAFEAARLITACIPFLNVCLPKLFQNETTVEGPILTLFLFDR